MSKYVASEVKARKSNKEKLKAVLAVIDSMDDEELGEVGSTPKASQLPSPQTNSGTSESGLLLRLGSLHNSSKPHVSANVLQHPSPTGSRTSSDDLDLFNSILS